MRATVVIGANFGDEGKGLMTDYFCSQAGSWATVVRFNGGAQAGHTVETPSGQRHVFHHFGSGTFARAFTCLGPEFLVNPVLFWQELDEIIDEFGPLPSLGTIRCHPRAQVTTPYDMMLNQLAERSRGFQRHGSCGVGIGETAARTDAGFGISFLDIGVKDRLETKLAKIEDHWVRMRAVKLGIPAERLEETFCYIRAAKQKFIEQARFMMSRVLMTDEMPETKIIFEGAQGLLLDQDHHYFPHVTRSNTGLTNVVPLAQRWHLEGLDVTYVTRAYLTRHGAGPMPNETRGPPYEGIVDRTNVPHPFQGNLRFGLLDLDLLAQSIRKDLESTGPYLRRINADIALTCTDHVGKSVGWYRGGRVFGGSIGDLVDAIKAATGLRVQYISKGPTRKDVEAQFP